MLKNKKRGFSLIDSLIAIAILSTVFFSIFGVFRLGTGVLFNNKARVGAISLANEQMEFIRSLSYEDVGTIGGIPSGNIPQEENISLNHINYTRKTLIQYKDDPKDGLDSSDENGISSDYKLAKISVSWVDKKLKTKSFSLLSNVVPKGIETNEGGGTLSISVFDSSGISVPGANVHIINDSLNPSVDLNITTNLEGKVSFPGSPSANNYEIIVSKSGYSTSKTYSSDAYNVNPNPANLSVIEGETTSASFPIDLISSKVVKTFFAISDEEWEDLFDDFTKISTTTNVEVSGGEVFLAKENGSYKNEGTIFSNGIKPEYLNKWDSFSWDNSLPENTNLKYHLYYSADTVNYNLIPNDDLSGNLEGFQSSPVDISGLDISNYFDLKLMADLETTDASSTPSILNWGIDYKVGPTPFPNVPFKMEGEKTIGSDGSGDPIKKYSEDLQTDSSGQITIGSLEWDNYTISLNESFGYDISEACNPQPFSLEPGVNVETQIILSPHTSNSLLISVRDSSGSLLNNVNIKLSRTGFEKTQTTESCGQTFFEDLSKGSVSLGNAYSIEASLDGYEDFNLSDVDISGYTQIDISLDEI